MSELGKPTETAARETFGIAGLLGEGRKVYYCSIFSARHIGRISDLLVAQLKGLLPNELRFRNVLLLSLYGAYRTQLAAQGDSQSKMLSQPLMIECGLDSEKIALGVSFNFPAESAWNPDEVTTHLAANAERVLVRVEESASRVELVSLLGLVGSTLSAAPVELVKLSPNVKVSPLKADYIELGDLDYATLLADEGGAGPREKPATGEFLSRFLGGQDKDERVRITGVTQHMGDEHIVEGMSVSNELENAKKQLELYRATIAELQAKLGTIEQQRQSERVVVTGPSSTPSFNSSFKEIIQNIWPFRREKKAEGEEAHAKQETAVASPVSHPSSSTPEISDSSDPASKLLKEQVETLQKTIDRVQGESEKLKKELGNGRAKKWAEGMVGELLSEKARLNEMSKKLDVTLRQKELEFRKKQQALQEELRKKDEQLKQKTYGLERAKEQLSQAASASERARGGHSMASEETQFRQKLMFTQKLLAAAKEESATLSRRLEEARGQLAVAQSASKARLQKDIEFDSMRSKHEKLLRQADEFKRANHQLMEKLSELEKQNASGNPDELRKKLENAMKLMMTHQKDAELYRMRVDELEKRELRLKSELKKASEALRSLKASAIKGGGDPGGGSQAA